MIDTMKTQHALNLLGKFFLMDSTRFLHLKKENLVAWAESIHVASVTKKQFLLENWQRNFLIGSHYEEPSVK